MNARYFMAETMLCFALIVVYPESRGRDVLYRGEYLLRIRGSAGVRDDTVEVVPGDVRSKTRSLVIHDVISKCNMRVCALEQQLPVQQRNERLVDGLFRLPYERHAARWPKVLTKLRFEHPELVHAARRYSKSRELVDVLPLLSEDGP